MTKDALSGHTAAQNTLGADGLRDGDAMSSATLTNTLQGIHGSGLLRLEDNAFTASNRNNPMLQPGAMTRASAFTLSITGGYVVLDGVLYEFAGGPGGSATMTLGDPNHGSGGVALAATGEEALYVIYVAANNGISNVHYEGGSPVNVANGLYPTIPSQYLTDYDTANANTNMKTVVLAVVRVQYKSSGGGSHNVDIQEINDKRVFLPSSIRYMPPVSSGGLASNRVSDGGAEGINTMTHLKDLLHTAGDAGDVAVGDSITALWPSHPRYDLSADPQVAATSTDPGFGQGPSRGKDLDGNYVKNALYFAGRNNEGTGHYSVRLDGQGVEATQTEITGSITKTITSDGDSFIMLKVATGQVVTLNPERDASANYKFPEGHIIEVCNEGVAGKGNIVFDNQTSPAGVNATLTPGDRATFVYEGSKWMSCNYPIAGGGAVSSVFGRTGAVVATEGDYDLDELGDVTITGTPTDLQVLIYEGATGWKNGWPEVKMIQVRNDEGSTIPAGAPLYSRGEIGGSNRILVGIADANDSAKMPCIGIAYEEMNTSSTQDNYGVVSGVYNSNISGFTGLNEGDTLYVSNTGTLTQTRPTGVSDAVQNVGIVLKTNGTICQGLLVSAIGRANDVPNQFSITGSITAGSFVKSGGTSSEFLKADGSVDTNTYSTTTYTDLQAVGAIQTAASITLDPSATFQANRSVVEDVTVSGLPVSATALDLMEDQRGKVLVNSVASITTMGLPDPGASQIGDTYVIINTHSGAVTIDRGGGLHGTPQNLNGAATNGTLPAHEAVTLIYVAVNSWYGIGL